ncbi:MAG: ABC transporter permease [Lachnospiraceae bacterium]|nr:ABC transporter permease [Lachnospiraceae bacterium]
MKQFWGYVKKIPVRKKIKYCTILVCVILLLVFGSIGSYFKNLSPDINAYKRWDAEEGYTQMAVYLPLGTMSDKMSYDGMVYQMQEALENESIEPENPKSRMLIGAYSGYGSITMQTELGNVTVDTIGVGGDFFYFHPVDLLDGSYLSKDSLMQDYVLLDKETAWKLFGATNVTGMTVMIDNTPFLVAGVYEPTDICLSKEAGLDESIVFMFYESLKSYGTVSGVQWLDFILPNPVKGFGEKILMENGVVTLEDAVVIENSKRFDAIPLYKMISDYLERIMSKSGIVYPYWENMARGYENILVACLLVETVCLVCSVGLFIHTIRPVKNIKRGINWIITKIRGRK